MKRNQIPARKAKIIGVIGINININATKESNTIIFFDFNLNEQITISIKRLIYISNPFGLLGTQEEIINQNPYGLLGPR